MKLILTRHGETIENQQGITQGHLPGTLSKKGIEQAEKLALRLKNEKIDSIYSSDLARAADTAKIIVKYHPGTPVYFVKDLRERDHGSLTGKRKEEVDHIEGEEPLADVYKRAKKIIDKAYEKYPNSTVLFVGHGAVNVILTTVVRNKPPEERDKNDAQSNTGVSIFEIKEDKNHKIHLLNCTKHLE